MPVRILPTTPIIFPVLLFFLSWTGIVLGGGLFSTLLYGFSNKYNYSLRKVKLTFANLPASFKGLRVVHISDIHSGSFNDKAAVTRGVEMVLNAQPDLILLPATW